MTRRHDALAVADPALLAAELGNDLMLQNRRQLASPRRIGDLCVIRRRSMTLRPIASERRL